jgi:hypothetical protein
MKTTKVAYETKLSNGTVITSYLATAIAEGFCEGEGASAKDQIKAWSYLQGTRIGYSLQGSFGRTLNSLVENGYLEKDGKVNWDVVNEKIEA